MLGVHELHAAGVAARMFMVATMEPQIGMIMSKTLKELAAEASGEFVQGACNLCALAQRFAQVQIELGEHVQGTDERNQHPITIMWLDKMNSLARIQAFDGSPHERVGDAYNWAHEIDTHGGTK